MYGIFDEIESEVRYYSRLFPVVFVKAKGSHMFDDSGKEYLDFFSGAGTMNYGHNNERLKARIINYLHEDGIVHALDMASVAKAEFLEIFQQIILWPRKYNYKVQFCGPTGTNCIEASLKLARKVTKRRSVLHFTNSFHGMSLGALSIGGSYKKKKLAGVSLYDSVMMPFCDYDKSIDTIAYFETYLGCIDDEDELPAAVFLETVQGEGGVNVASPSWLARLYQLTKKFGILFIIDDIQVGCGRTGPFFSFDEFNIIPDMVCLSKSLSGYGLPLSILLMKPELDVWAPGEHSGTFRGNNLALVAATEALKSFWQTDELEEDIHKKSKIMSWYLSNLQQTHSDVVSEIRGRGMIQGIVFRERSIASTVLNAAFEKHLIVETCGRNDEVLKLLPPLTISSQELVDG
ncbi:MAG: diaminobutyrate--2-oxoglutarate transaminase, partial [Nitrososphaera sp.]